MIYPLKVLEELLHNNKFSLVQTLVKMPPEALEEIFSFYFCNKTLRRAVPTGLLKLSEAFYFHGHRMICENRESLHRVEISLYTVRVLLRADLLNTRA